MEIAPPVGVRWHEYADIFPWIEGEAFRALVEDIRKNGVLEPIVFLDGAILDGRNRYMAARELGIEYPRVEYEGDDPLGFVVSHNLTRRHLDSSQRAMVAKRLANAKQGERRDIPANEGRSVTQEEAASALNVSVASVERAAIVQRDGAPELIAAVDKGLVSVSAAADVSTLPKPEQAEIVARGEKEILEAAKAIRAEKAVARREERLDRIADISKDNAELSTEVRYPIIYADPPWRYENPPMGGTNRSIENHYPTMTLEEICALPVADLATEDAMLYLWATAPKLAECMQVIAAWGFEYRTNLVWDKEVIGMGYHARNQHEILLVAKRGEIPPPEAGKQPASVHRERRTEHSAKPEFYYEMIEQAYPQLPKIELFCRSPREGWSVWGNQSGGEADAA
ncbi:S-adenosylmethionine-binding protein [Mesorhizobium sp. M2D.F.Ca.ET.223.01.1.1]|uniref:MT-A70 family methyltransferase n=1 Tax=Mesorhizobium sp. M2D.F.Ca.ET.223.01.1.1 TaxID=2563940 RepID=UPI0010925819|nr:MT-A70 family methyltransferase [Mesorhizobium sp. M2D.F.Ca.ET.223.01.1.1]TGR83316.1 S-adenosylmethionine-binding protein [Mesorhizobium sp. M2D.F.Ca.ET.223.01.1.1]